MASLDKKIEIDYGSEFATFKLGSTATIQINVIKSDDTATDVTSDPNTSIFSQDGEYIFFNPDDNTVTFKKEGSGILKAIYINSEGKKFVTTQEFVVYETWFKDNYINYLVSSFDKNLLESNTLARIIMDTCMEMMDVFYAYVKDLEVVDNFKGGKSKFLNLVAQNIGFERIDFESVDTSDEEKSNETFRELLSNILDLVGIRGSVLSYHLFFGALGYDVELQEFWWDDEGNLIEIDPKDDTQSTFYAYRTDGTAVDDPQIPRPDPRRFSDPNGDVFINSKSNYLRALLSVKNVDIAPDPGTFTEKKRNIIKQYLEYLRPSHMQYMQEIISATLGSDELDLEATDLFLSSILTLIDIDGGDGPSGGPGDEIDIDAYIEGIILGTIKTYAEELSYTIKWDAENKWDSGIKWDQRAFLNENFSFVEL